jgi:hypothetical protein
MVRNTIAEVIGEFKTQLGASYDRSQFPKAAELFEQMILSERLSDFLTLGAYRFI